MTLNHQHLRKLPVIVILLLTLFNCTQTVENSNKALQLLAGEKLHSLLDSDWQRYVENYPEMASYLGDNRFNAKWSDLSLTAIAEQHQQDKAVLAKLKGIDYQALSASDKVNYDLFKWQVQASINEYEFSPYLTPVTQRDGVQSIDTFAQFIPFNTVQDYQNWLKRLKALPTLISQVTALMKEGMKRGVMPPKITMSRVPAQIQKQLVNQAEKSLFFSKFSNYPENFSLSDQQVLTEQALQVIKNDVIPAYQAFYNFFKDEYLPACRDTVGLSALPQGKAYYQHLINYHTTTQLTPDEIHNIGLKEVARNKAEMDKVIQEVKFKGSFAEFLTFLRTDPQFYYQTPEALLEAYQAISKRLDPQLPKLFGKLPRMPYGVIPIPSSMAPDTTTAYYSGPSLDGTRAGYYYVNLYQPQTRPKYEMEVLSVHEGVPGHHLQIALQMELGELPNFRRYRDFTVFTEGWGLYSERLGYDMGLYKDPYSRFGQLTYDMWRAVRLVVDTGMHYKGWSRQQAIDYFTSNAAKSKEDIINEVDRYISMPGQALAYKIGQLKILELRDKAEKSLGDKFDIRSFHDMVLGSGSIPLNVLEENTNKWIESQQKVH